jgi:hypothetical protein
MLADARNHKPLRLKQVLYRSRKTHGLPLNETALKLYPVPATLIA